MKTSIFDVKIAQIQMVTVLPFALNMGSSFSVKYFEGLAFGGLYRCNIGFLKVQLVGGSGLLPSGSFAPPTNNKAQAMETVEINQVEAKVTEYVAVNYRVQYFDFDGVSTEIKSTKSNFDLNDVQIIVLKKKGAPTACLRRKKSSEAFVEHHIPAE